MMTPLFSKSRRTRLLIGVTSLVLTLTGTGWAAEAPSLERERLQTEDQLRERDRDQTRQRLHDALEQHLQTMEKLRTQLREQDRAGVDSAIQEGRQLALQLRERERLSTGSEGAVQEVRAALQRHAGMLNQLHEQAMAQDKAQVNEALRVCTRAEETAQLRLRTMEERQVRDRSRDDVVRPSDMRPGQGAQEGARRQMGAGEHGRDGAKGTGGNGMSGKR